MHNTTIHAPIPSPVQRGQGDKPQEFLNLVPRGLLPAMEIDGKVMTESLDIMYLGSC